MKAAVLFTSAIGGVSSAYLFTRPPPKSSKDHENEFLKKKAKPIADGYTKKEI